MPRTTMQSGRADGLIDFLFKRSLAGRILV
jgi:hypothetical protein